MPDIEKKWLVKSDSKIMGPYSFEQMEELLLRRQIALIDEVRDMDRRWLYIREIPELQEMVESVRNQLESKSEATKTLQTATQLETTNQSQTATIEASTPPPMDTVSHVPTDVQFEEPVDVSFVETETDKKEPQRKFNKTTFVSTVDPAVKKEAKSYSQFIIRTVGVLFVLSVIFFYSYQYYLKKNAEQAEKDILVQIRKYAIQGADRKAIEAYQRLPDYLHDQAMIELLHLIPQMESAGLVRTNVEIEKLRKAGKLTVEQKSKLDLIQFTQSLNMLDIKNAERFLLQAKDLDPNSVYAQESEAQLYYLQKEYKKSYEIFESLFKADAKGRFLYGMLLNHLKSPNTADAQLIDKIDRYISTRVDFKKELLIGQIYLSGKTNNTGVIQMYLKDFLSVPPRMSYEFKIAPFLYQKIYDQKNVLDLVPDIKNYFNAKDYALFEMHTKLEVMDLLSAQRILDQYQSSWSKDDRANAQIALDYFQRNYTKLVAAYKANQELGYNMASHLFLLKAKLNIGDGTADNHVSYLKKEKNVISLWAELLNIPSESKQQLKIFLDSNVSTYEDFLPFIEAKSSLD